MRGFPKYKLGDKVHFEITTADKTYSEDGEIVVVDKWGTFEDNSDVSYDIELEDGTWWKHIKEKHVSLRQ